MGIRHLKITVISLVLMLFGSSCTKEDLSSCEGSLLLNFHYTYNIQNEDLFSTSIDNVELFVYDQNSVLVQNYKVNKSDFIEGNKYRLMLNQGVYTIVAIGEAKTSYIYNSVEDYQMAYISAKRDSMSTIPAHIDNLFHAIVEQVTIKSSSKEVQQELFFTKNSNHIRVIIREEFGTKAASAVTCEINAVNGDYKFDNTIYGSDRVHYIPTPLGEAAEQTTDFNVLKLWSGDDSKLVVKDRVQTYYDGSLSALLLQKPGTDLTLKHDFELVFIRNLVENTVKITVDGWEVIDHNSGL